MKKINISILCLLFTLTGSRVPAGNAPDASLILSMSFDEINNRTVKDHSQYGNHGELVGNPTLVDGKFGKALKFNGHRDYVEIPHDDSLTVDKNVTVMAWIKTSRHGGPKGARWQCIVAKGNDLRSYSFYTYKGTGVLHLSVDRAKGGGSERHVLLNRWQHVAAQVDNGRHRYWINGELAADYLVEATLPGRTDTASVRVGNSHDAKPASSPDRHFLGLIDELRIYNRALRHDEIVREMNRGHTAAQNIGDSTGAQPP